MATPPRNRSDRLEAARDRSAAGLGWVRERMAATGLSRPSHGRVAAGVLAGLARRLGISPWLLRGAFLISVFLPGPQFVLYVVLWIAMPREP